MADLSYGGPSPLHLIVVLHENTGAYVRLGNKLSSRFCTSSGVRQGCILAPDLFCVAIDWILDHMCTKPRLEVGGQIFSDLVYADDTAFLFSSEDNIAPCLHSFSQTAATLGLRTLWAKTSCRTWVQVPVQPVCRLMATVLNPLIVLSTLAVYNNLKTTVVQT